jgi:hypothetical protein
MEQSIKIFRTWIILAGLCGIYIVQRSCQMMCHWFQRMAEKWEASITENEKYLCEKMHMKTPDEPFWLK